MTELEYDYFVGSTPDVDEPLPSIRSWVSGFVGFTLSLLLALGLLVGAAASDESSSAAMVLMGLLAVGLGFWAVRAPKRNRESNQRTAQAEVAKRKARERALRLSGVEQFTGARFERFVGDLYRRENLSVQEVGGPGDMGADLILSGQNGSTTAVQVKRSESPVSRRAVSDVSTAAEYYDCEDAVVVTNSTFTAGARELAASLGINLVGQSKLADWLIREREILLQDLSAEDLSGFDPADFEWIAQRFLLDSGWKRAEVVGGSGDLGADVIGWGDGEKIVVQAKRHSGSVSRQAVSDARAAARHFEADESMVITTGRFTSDARELANSVGCVLIGRSDLSGWLSDWGS